jgi:hypothetical protein
MELEKFIRDMFRIYKIPYLDVRRDGTFKYTVNNPGAWAVRTEGIVSVVKIDVGGRRFVLSGDTVLPEAELCLKNGRCLSAGGVKVRIGAIILAHYSWLDMLPVPITRKKMLRYINNVERNPELAEFAVWALAARSALDDEAIEIATAVAGEIRKMRSAAYAARV